MDVLRKRALGMVLALGVSGCHSAYINSTISNETDKPVSLIQVDYPSASFGVQSLNPGQNFKYRFKVLGSGPVKVSYTDGLQHDHKATGPILREGNEGSLRIVIANDGVHWDPASFPPGR
ncbi:MAG TPA: hypothetical protein VNW54_11600 [Granulicella sp.]|jgi:hypothetical protein|nr:hypothetical protein [Granulicella sp.]